MNEHRPPHAAVELASLARPSAQRDGLAGGTAPPRNLAPRPIVVALSRVVSPSGGSSPPRATSTVVGQLQPAPVARLRCGQHASLPLSADFCQGTLSP